MIIRDAKFITSAADRKGFVRPDKPMVAVCGKSNVGKSSFINMLANRNKLARTSAEPGRTRLVNYFDFGEFILAARSYGGRSVDDSIFIYGSFAFYGDRHKSGQTRKDTRKRCGSAGGCGLSDGRGECDCRFQ